MRRAIRLATVGSALISVSIASGATSIDSKTSLNLGPAPGQFTGAVRAGDPVCVSGRTIKVKRVEAGRDQTVTRDFSDITGLWERTTDERSGTWYAKLKRERRGGNLCLGDKSAKRSAG